MSVDSVIENIQTIQLREVPKYIDSLPDDWETLTSLEKTNGNTKTSVYFEYDSENKKLYKVQKKTNLSKNETKESKSEVKIKDEIEDGKVPFKEMIKKMRSLIKSGYSFQNVTEKDIQKKPSDIGLASVFSHCCSSKNIGQDVKMYILEDIDLSKPFEIYDKGLNNEKYKKVTFIKQDGKSYIIDAIQCSGLDVNWTDKINEISEITSGMEVPKYKTIKMNLSDYESLTKISNEVSMSLVKIDGIDSLFYLSPVESFVSDVFSIGNKKGNKTSSKYCYVKVKDSKTSEYIYVKTDIESIVLNQDSCVGCKALVLKIQSFGENEYTIVYISSEH